MGSEGHMCPLRMCPSIHGEECDPPRGRRAKLVDSSLVNCYDNESALRPLGLRLLRSVPPSTPSSYVFINTLGGVSIGSHLTDI